MSKETRDELRVRVPHALAKEIEDWADEEYPGILHGRRQLLLTEILCDAVRRRRDTVRVRKNRARRKGA